MAILFQRGFQPSGTHVSSIEKVIFGALCSIFQVNKFMFFFGELGLYKISRAQ